MPHGTGQRPASGGQERRTTPPVEASVRPVALRVHLVHWHVLRFMLRQRGGAGCGRAALRLARLRRGACGIRSLGRRLAARLACAPAIARWLAHRLAHGLGLCCCFRSRGRRLAARRSVVCPLPATSVACALALALLCLSMSAGLCVQWYDRNGCSPAWPGQGRAGTDLGPRDPCTEQYNVM